MSLGEEAVFPSKWFLRAFLVQFLLATVTTLYFRTGWIMWIFPLYTYLWSKGLQNKRTGLRVKG